MQRAEPGVPAAIGADAGELFESLYERQEARNVLRLSIKTLAANTPASYVAACERASAVMMDWA